jgi:hypothetical protein
VVAAPAGQAFEGELEGVRPGSRKAGADDLEHRRILGARPVVLIG